jgi:hypothetical protein
MMPGCPSKEHGMRRLVKFLHTVSACGLVGALMGYMVVLAFAPQSTPQSYAEMRQTLGALSNYMLFPSLGVGLVSGIVAMMVHRPFQDLRWVWAKALLGFGMFEGTLAIVQARANSAAEEAQRVASGGGDAQALAGIIANEWAAAQIGLGIWRPRLGAR